MTLAEGLGAHLIAKIARLVAAYNMTKAQGHPRWDGVIIQSRQKGFSQKLCGRADYQSAPLSLACDLDVTARFSLRMF